MDTGTAAKGITEQGLRLLDKVTEFRFALALLSIAITFDVALVWIANRNILTMEWSGFSADSFARLGVDVVAYVFWMAVLSPLVRILVEHMFALLGNTRLGSVLNDVVEPAHESDERRYAWGRVRVGDAKLRALRDKDTFWMAQVEKVEAKAREEWSEMTALANLSFSVVGLLLLDWWSDYSIAGEVAAWLNGYGGQAGSLAKLGVLACMLVDAFPWLHRVRTYIPSET
jgi:hypothetical protein